MASTVPRMERFVHQDLSDAEFRDCGFHRTRFVGVEMSDVTIEGEVRNVVINGVEVGEYVEAELDRRHPERPLLRSSDPAELREGWARLQQEWAGTIARIRGLPGDQVRASVGGEWSALQTLRHLVFATDSWFRRGVLDHEEPFWPAGMGWSGMPRGLVEAIDDDADPGLDEALEVRARRVAEIGDYLAAVDRATLEGTGPTLVGGWPPPDHTRLQCLHVVLNEEWWHRRFVERDLDKLGAGRAS